MRRAVDKPSPMWVAPVPVRTWMQTLVETVRPETPAAHAAALMRERRIRHLPVVDGDGLLRGIVTDRDLRQVIFAPHILERLEPGADVLADLPVREVMTWDVVTIGPDHDLRDAARLMHERKIGGLPVVDQGRLVGILTETDLLRAFEVLMRDRVVTVKPLRVSGNEEGAAAELSVDSAPDS